MRIEKLLFLFSLTFLVGKSNAQVVINEFSASNYTQFIDDFDGTEDWIELYNAGTSSVNLSGYYLSDDDKAPTKWKFPVGANIEANGFVRVWCSSRNVSDVATGHYHTSFKLTQTKKKSETITFSSPQNKILDSKKLLPLLDRQSWARKPNGGAIWFVNKTPSPNESNDNNNMFSDFAERPSVSVTGGFYPTAQTITLATVDTSLTIRYTLNGYEPTLKSPIYTTPIVIDTVKVLKAKAFSKDPNILPSFTQFQTYFVNKTHTLIVLSIAGDSLETLANGNNQIRPSGSFEYFLQDKTKGSKGYGEFNSHGQDSWKNKHRSIDFEMRDEFGYNSAINEKIFDLSERNEFQKVILRAAGDDNYPANLDAQNKGSAHMRDAYVQNLAKRGGLKLDVRTAQKAIVYINGKYWGVYDIRERPDDHDYADYYYNQDKFNLQYIQTWGNTWAEYGGNKALSDWDNLYNYILKSDVTKDSVYQKITAQYDVESLVDYMFINTFTVCSDWLNYNTGWWRGQNPAGGHQKWGYTLWDNDATFAFYINYTGIKDTSANASICQHQLISGNSDPKGHVKVLNKLRQNKDFDQYYVTRQIELMNTVFTKENMLGYFDSVYNVIKPEMPQQVKRWGGTMAGWEANVKRLRSFIERRCTAVQSNIKPCYKLTGPYPLTLVAEPVQQVKEIKLNNMTITEFPFTLDLYYGGVNTKVSVTQNNGTKYVFDKWEGKNTTFVTDSSKQVAVFKINKADTITAKFKLITNVGTEDNILTDNLKVFPTLVSQNATLDFYLPDAMPVKIDLYNISGQKVHTIDYQMFSQGEHQQNIDLNDYNLQNGPYILQFTAGKYQTSTKIIFQR